MEETKKAQLPKIRTVCIDTLTGIQSEEYMTSSSKPGHDDWMDYGKAIWGLITDLQKKGFEIVLILGEPGTGKSTGMRTLPHNTNVWMNADNKNPVWKGGRTEYGDKNSPRKPYHMVPKSYKSIMTHITKMIDRGMMEERRYAIVTGHIEDYKSGAIQKKRLKTLGKVATAFQLEGKLETVLYAEVVKKAGKMAYVLTTENDGRNTARSPMEAFDPVIDNDYNAVINTLLEY